MTKLNGSEKQVAWAEEIRSSVEEMATRMMELEAKEALTISEANELSSKRTRIYKGEYEFQMKTKEDELGLTLAKRRSLSKEEKASRKEALKAYMTDWSKAKLEEILSADEAKFYIDTYK